MTKKDVTIGHTSRTFNGFEHLDANYIYCPNQFFEVCLRHYSRGVVRLVAYMLRRTLGYLDGNGNPVRQDIRISYSAISKRAGISTRAIPKALQDAESGGFIVCVTPGVANSRGRRGQAGEYRLRWSCEGDDYTDDPKQFCGFYAGEGHRSPIPNGYFDVVVRQETLAMAKLVGTVLRHTVGYRNQFGGRRADAPLPYSYIQRFANVKDRTTLSETTKKAMQKRYICRMSKGCFDPRAGRQSRAASYAVKWLEKATNPASTAKTLPDRSEHGREPTGDTAQTLPEKHGKNPTDRKTVPNTPYKQQAVVAENSEGYRLLVGEGIGNGAALSLAKSATAEEIRSQVEWLEFRNPANRPAMLRRAIEEKWSEPDGAVERRQQEHSREREDRADAEQAARDAAIADRRKKRLQHRTRLLARWKEQPTQHRLRYRQTAVREATSGLQRRFLERSSLDSPATDILEVMALAMAESIGDSA